MTVLKPSEMVSTYDPMVCDLCGSPEFNTILDMPEGSMTSDTQIVEAGLRKFQCAGCELARNGYALSDEELRTHYEEDYELGEQAAIAEPLFFTKEGPMPRSRVIFNWIMENLRAVDSRSPRSVLEVGCGEGSLLSQFAESLREADVSGIDMSGRSVHRALERGLKVEQGNYRDTKGSYDLIYSFAVIEHVTSPSDFLRHLKEQLAPGGLLITAQPCQDGGSHDIFFSDHLHHFFSQHIAELGRRTGLTEIRRAKDDPYIADFSLHVFKREAEASESVSSAPSEDNKIELHQTVEKWKTIFSNLDEWLGRNRKRKLAVWGVGQMFTLLSAYTSLRHHPIEVAFDDNPKRFAESGFPFPVVVFEEAELLRDPDLIVLLTFTPGSKVLDRLKEKSVEYYCPL
jgi:SAM-dependent methyltransferase